MVVDSGLEALDYKDVLLLPKATNINSRDEIGLQSPSSGSMPIFSAPMERISEANLVSKFSELGGIGLLHRFFDGAIARENAMREVARRCKPYDWGVAIGINDLPREIDYALQAVQLGAAYICVDTANGYMQKTLRAVEQLFIVREYHGFDFKILSGNVVTPDGVIHLASAGCDIVRVGIGSGSLCSTSNVTGIGCPSLTAIAFCAQAKRRFPEIKILADGGIRSSGEAIKALVWGADYLMIGSLLAKSQEANNGGRVYGMSSTALQRRMGKPVKSNEGLEWYFADEEIRPVQEIFDEFLYGIKSGLSYLNCRNIEELSRGTFSYVRTGTGTLKNM